MREARPVYFAVLQLGRMDKPTDVASHTRLRFFVGSGFWERELIIA